MSIRKMNERRNKKRNHNNLIYNVVCEPERVNDDRRD
jgi:hypothetical protein